MKTRTEPQRTRLAILLAGLLVLWLAQVSAAATTVRVSITDPRDGDHIARPSQVVLLKGRASAHGIEAPTFDIALVIDTSGSTRIPTGVDVNGNGIVGRRSNARLVIGIFGIIQETSTDPGDSVLAAEVLAAKRLLSQLDPRTTRVAVISFAGDYLPGTGHTGNQTFLANPATPDAFLEQPLTRNFHLARLALDQIEQNGPMGGTNIAEGIRLAISELTGLSGSGSTPRPGARKVILLLTDGIPTFPVGSATTSDPEDIQAAISAAQVAGRFGIQIHTFAIGKEALREPYTVKEVARVTGGRFTPLPNPADIITALPGVSLIDLRQIEVINKTTGERALEVQMGPDGSFKALVPVQTGLNRLQAVAYASDGSRDQDSITINFRKLPGQEKLTLDLARQSTLDLELERARTEQLRLELERLKEQNLALELEKARREKERLEKQLARLRELKAKQEEERQRLAEMERLEQQLEAAQRAIEEAERQEKERWATEQRRRRERLELELKVKDKGTESSSP